MKRDLPDLAWSLYSSYFSSTGNSFKYKVEDILKMCRIHSELTQYFSANYASRIINVELKDLQNDVIGTVRKVQEFLDFSGSTEDSSPTEMLRKTASNVQVGDKSYKKVLVPDYRKFIMDELGEYSYQYNQEK